MNDSPPTTVECGPALTSWARQAVAKVGGSAQAQWREIRHGAAIIGTVLGLAFRPGSWARPVRMVLARQVLAIGVEPLWLVGTLAIFVGMSVVVQLTFWVGEAGQSQLLGPLLVAVIARELGPMLINLVVIVRSGSAMTTELGVLKIRDDVREFEAQGSDPFLHLVVPRVLGMALSTFCLTVFFILVVFVSGFLFAAWMGKGTRDFFLFADTISRAIQLKDIFGMLAKSILPALFASASCCIGGLGVGEVTDIPQATQRALTRCVAGLFVIAGMVSLLTYL